MSKCGGCKLDLPNMKHRVYFEKKVTVQDEYGGATETWQNVASAWAAIEPKLGSEKWFGGRIEDNVSHILKMRYLPGVTTDMRIIFEGRIFHIKNAISPMEEKLYLHIAATEGVGT